MQRLIIVLGVLLISFQVFSASEKDSHGHDKEEGFNPGTMIVDHVIDAHEWHVMDIGHTHVSIPLPIILVHEGKLNVFMSSKFHHGHE